ncbi:MAG: DUF2207 domain-containing protein [Deltaproteobacteria bacterium]|nr:DUF2207 domain-containing protein [Deltaproteobacteria bacterium]MBW2394041.1 DUF2207 domain-containing protein [Deltaproteobacteria bacterium]
MRHWWLGPLALLLLLGATPMVRAEHIVQFETEIYLGTDDDFSVVEKIRYEFGNEARHGIYREIPVAYGRGRAADYRIRLEVESVTDPAGNAWPYKVSRSGGVQRIRIGDPDRTVTGTQEYWIRYGVERGYLYFESHDELYWEATGHGWKVPTDAALASVYLPEGVAAESIESQCYAGPFGTVLQNCTITPSGGVLLFRSDHSLRPREGLTLVVGLPKGVLDQPSGLERFVSRAGDYLNAWSLLPLLALGGMFRLWRTQGRDRGTGAAIPVRYEPPEGLTPAEVGTVLDEKVDLIDITSTLLDLAVRGYLRIEELESEGFLFLTNKDYRLVKLREPMGVRRHESILMNRLFEDSDQVLVSSLKNNFYKHLPDLKAALYQQVSKGDRLFPTSPEKVRQKWALAGIAGLVAGVIAFFIDLSAALPIGLVGGIVLAFSPAMPRRTRRGRKVYEEICGFQEFVERVDRDRLERMGQLDPGRFEKLLPFAIVLGVGDQWADAFADVYTEPPNWYVGSHRHGFAPRVFVTDLGQSLDTMGQSLRSQPSQSGSGSSGLGGGGSGGGGFGGGGGGSW